MRLATDDAGRRRPGRETFSRARKAEHAYGRDLRRVARHIGDIVRSLAGTLFGNDPIALPNLTRTLDRYGDLLIPWAEAVATRMLADVDRRDAQAWAEHSRNMSLGIRQELRTAPTGFALRDAMARQVDLITSLPREAAERVHKLAIEGLTSGERTDGIVAEIMRTGAVTRSRADTIARTETSRAASTLTQVRAQHIGSSGYQWLTAHDSDVRPSHRKMEGQFVRWDSPPTLDGMTGHAGTLINCRCIALPLVPETF